MKLFKKRYDISRNLQQDIIQLEGKKIFLNPFLYCSKIDKNTNQWLKELGQISDLKIARNRIRFYPKLKWEYLTDDEKILKNGTIELFLKTLELINSFHPSLNSDQLLQIEKKLAISKKASFEKWVAKYIAKKSRLLQIKKNKLLRENQINNLRSFLFMKETKKFIISIFVIIVLSTSIGWFAGISKNSCNPYFESTKNKI